MPSPAIRLRRISVYGANMPSHEGSGYLTGDVQVWMRRDSEARIELAYELAEENRFVVVPRLTDTKMVTSGRNNSRKFRVELTGARIIEHVKQIGQEQDKGDITRILRPYLQLTAQLRVEVASTGRPIEQGYAHKDRLMPINNITVSGLAVPFASDKRTYVIDGIEFKIQPPAPYRSIGIVTAVVMPDRRSHIIIRPGNSSRDNPSLYVSSLKRSGVRMRPVWDVYVEGTEVKAFLGHEAQALNSPREVWAAIAKYYQHLRLNFRIRPDAR